MCTPHENRRQRHSVEWEVQKYLLKWTLLETKTKPWDLKPWNIYIKINRIRCITLALKLVKSYQCATSQNYQNSKSLLKGTHTVMKMVENTEMQQNSIRKILKWAHRDQGRIKMNWKSISYMINRGSKQVNTLTMLHWKQKMARRKLGAQCCGVVHEAITCNTLQLPHFDAASR